MATDILILSPTTGPLQPDVWEKLISQNMQAYQQFTILLLSNNSGLFRHTCGTDLMSLISGANLSAEVVQVLAPTACAQALQLLDPASRRRIRQASCTINQQNAGLVVEVMFEDGQVIGREFR